MANTIKEMLANEYADFGAALEGKFEIDGARLVLNRQERVFVKDARDSIGYILQVLDHEVLLPSSEEDVNSDWGQVYGYFRGSVLNLVMAEYLVYGQWSNIEGIFSPSVDDEDEKAVTKARVSESDEDDDDDEDCSMDGRSLAERFADKVRSIQQSNASRKTRKSEKEEAKPKKHKPKKNDVNVACEVAPAPVVVVGADGKEITPSRMPKQHKAKAETPRPRPMTGIPEEKPRKSSKHVYFDEDED